MKFEQVELGKLCKLINGKAFKPEDWSTDGVPIIRIQNLNDSSKPFNYWSGSLDNQVKIKYEDVLLAWSGTPGTSFGAHIWYGGNGILNQHIFKLELDLSRITKKWALFSINSQLQKLIDQAHGGVGLKHVTKSMVENLQIPLPPLAEQQRIAAILDKADALREKRRRTIAKLDELQRSVFLEMFGDPVSNPKGWKCLKMEDLIAEGPTNGLYKPASQMGSGYILLDNKGLFRGLTADFSDPRKVALSDKEFKKYQLKERDLLFNRVSVKPEGVGKAVWVDKLQELSVYESNIMRVRLKFDQVIPEYIVYFLDLPSMRTKVISLSNLANQASINQQAINSIPVLVPPISQQENFVCTIKKIWKLKDSLKESLSKLETLFLSLQQRAFSGELFTQQANEELNATTNEEKPGQMSLFDLMG